MNEKIKIGDTVIMPEPNFLDDAWCFGGFCGTVAKVIDSNLCIVENADGVEINRLELEK